MVLDYPKLEADFPPEPSAAGGRASLVYIEDAIGDAKRSVGDPWRLNAIVTAPISKTSWKLAGGEGARFPGHTELLSERFGAKSSAMMFVGPSLNVVLATIHLPLSVAAAQLDLPTVRRALAAAAQGCAMLGIAKPRIAVCGLNPHAGEGGLMGDEEQRFIAPAIDAARAEGIDARGPLPADAVFVSAAAGEYDCVVAMYHDQGLIPAKLLDRGRTVNMTVGLPRPDGKGWAIRTSPAHGTAFDIAGHNKADPGSMIAAIELAARLASPHAGVPR